MMDLGFLAGYRTKLGAAALILAGLTRIASGVGSNPLDWSAVTEGLASIGAGLAALGIRFSVTTSSGAGTAAGQTATGG